MKEVVFLAILCMGSITGCSSTGSFARDDLREEIGIATPVYREGSIEEAFKKTVNLPKPFSVAVYFKATDAGEDWRWSLEDKRKVLSQLRANVSEDYVSKIFLINNSVEQTNLAMKGAQPNSRAEELANIRLAAAQYQADAVLIVDGIGKVSKSPNRWGTSYLLIAPALFVNGTTADSFFAINATLWDVRNEVLYLSLNAEGSVNKNYPAAWGDSDQVYYEKSKQVALADLEKAIKQDFNPFNNR